MIPTFHTELTKFIQANPHYLPPTSDPDIEQHLSEALTKEDLISLELPTYLLPQIHRPLPRLCLQTDPTINKIKDPFRSLPELKKHFIDRALTHLYTPISLSQNASLVLFTWVIADGLGDFYSQREAARVLRQAFPQLQISLVTLIHHTKPLPETDAEYLIRYTGEINKPIIYEAFSETLCTLLSTADLILEFPTIFFDLHKYTHPDQVSKIGEYGGYRFVHYHPQTGGRSMGLHFMERGVFCKQLPPPNSQVIHSLHPALAHEDILSTHTFNCAYTKTVRGTYLYLLTLISALQTDLKDCAICFLNLPWLKQLLEIKFSHPQSPGVMFLNACGIKEIHILSKRHTEVLTFNPRGKIIRIIDAGHLSQAQVAALFSSSHTLIGCTGDQSILEAIATGTPFFYDPPAFKRPFLKDLKALAEKRLSLKLAEFFRLCLLNPEVPSEEPSAGWVNEESLELCEDSEEIIAHNLAKLLTEVRDDFLKLKEIIHSEYAFEPFLINHVKRKLHLRQHPDLASFENKQLDAFAHGKQSGKVTLEKIRNCLKTANGSQYCS